MTPGRGRHLDTADPAAAAVVLIGLNPLVVLHTVGGGHNDALVLVALAGALLLALPLTRARVWSRTDDPTPDGPAPGSTPSDLGTRSLGVTLLLVLATLVKVVAAIPLGLWLVSVALRPGRTRGSRARAVAGHLALAVIVTAATLVLPFTGSGALTSIANLAGRQGYASAARMVARVIGAGARAVAGSGAVDPATGITFALFLALFAAAVLRMVAPRRGDARPEEWGAALLLFALAAPYLLPWYGAWFVPFLVLPHRREVWPVGIALCAALALTGVPAEPAVSPALWNASIFAVHWVVAPFVLVLLVVALRRTLRQPSFEGVGRAGARRRSAAPS